MGELMDLKEEWDRVMTQAEFSFKDKGNTIMFTGENGGFVFMDAKAFQDAVISVVYPKTIQFDKVNCDYKYHNKDIQYLGSCEKCNSNIKIVNHER